MPYCSKCGVKVDNSVNSCPLCQFPIPDIDELENSEERFPDPENSYPLKRLAKKKQTFSVFSTLIIIAVGLVLYIDYQINHDFTWSKLSTISIIASWFYVFILFGFVRLFLLNLMLFSANTLVLTLCIDYFIDDTITWFYTLALPLVLMFTMLSVLFAFLFSKTKRRGINVVSYILVPASFYCLGTEAFISKYVLGEVILYWSVIVLITALPISFLLLYLHYGIPEKYWVKLKRKFHF